jgi:hypothetical protein
MGARLQVATCFINITKSILAIVVEHSIILLEPKYYVKMLNNFAMTKKKRPKIPRIDGCFEL